MPRAPPSPPVLNARAAKAHISRMGKPTVAPNYTKRPNEFPCPNCRTKYTHESVEQNDEWNADDIIDALLEPDEDFIDNSVSPNASAGKRRCARFAA